MTRDKPNEEEDADASASGADGAADTESRPSEEESPSEDRPSRRLARLPSSDEFAAFAEDSLDDAFDSISSASLSVPTAEPSVSFDGAPSTDATDAEAEAEGLEEDGEGEGETQNSFGDSLPEVWEGCHPLDRVTTLAQRIHMCEATARVHELFQSSTDQEIATSNVMETVKEFEEELEGIKPKSRRGRELTKSMNELLEPIEAQQAEYEKKIPVSWLRGPYLKLDLDFAIRVGYFHAYLYRSDLSAAWWERVVILAVGSASSADKMGMLSTLPISYVSVLWDELFPDTHLDLEKIQASVQFFHDAAGQLPELEDPRHLFTTDIYIDVIAYQLTLREALFRPEILYACVEFHVQLANWAAGDEAGRVLLLTMNEDISVAYEKVKAIFKAALEDEDAIEKMKARLRGHEAGKKRAKEREEKANRYGRKADLRRKKAKERRRRIAFRVITGTIILVMGLPIIQDLVGISSRDLKEMSARDTENVHPMLSTASISKEARLMVATIDGDRWALLSGKQRKKLAIKLISVSKMRALQSVMVYADDVMVIDVSGGALRYME